MYISHSISNANRVNCINIHELVGPIDKTTDSAYSGGQLQQCSQLLSEKSAFGSNLMNIHTRQTGYCVT